MKKLRILSALITAVLVISFSAYAAPATIAPGQTGGNGNFIVIQNPPTDKAATFDKSYIISGYGKQGVNVYIYKLENGTYVKTDYSWTIGASGMFFKKINLTKGTNALICYAEDGGVSQSVYLQITYLGTDLTNKINDIRIGLDTLK
ncbi:MAG: hypothetical protein IJM94_02355 [Clostridia bacterium]|nr:hypothetical protein [Clostridia bacterium]MBQ7075622.1 hypothetical protein [Clostridia bacterium]MBQ9997748.1 hypothetical protein [Clostridia bacterium]